MSLYDGFRVTIFGVDGTRWDVHGPDAGRQNVWIGEGQLAGILDAPLESAWSESARGGGAKHIRDRYLPRDMTVGFHVDGDRDLVLGTTATAFARALTSPPYAYSPTKRTARMEVTTELSGKRTIYFRATEVPDIDLGRDVIADRYENPVYSLRAGVPWWKSETLTPVWETSGSSGAGTVTVTNPGDVPARYLLVLTPGKWTVPDPSWVGEIGQVAPGGANGARTIPVNVPVAAGGAVLSRDPRRLPIASSSGQNLISPQEGKFLIYDIPPWTPPTDLPISVTGAPAGGARAEYRIDVQWTRAWGMEAPTLDD